LGIRRRTGWWSTPTPRSTRATAATGATASRFSCTSSGCARCSSAACTRRRRPACCVERSRAFDDYPVLERTRGQGELTLLHVVRAAELEDYERRAREWAQAVWDAWSDHHARIRAALDPVL
jgi:hypothetical protein